MAISVYSGLQGHGKTYEVVANVVVNAIADGRRVVTNIAGLNTEAIKAYILADDPKHDGNFGEIVTVAHDAVGGASFFPVELAEGAARTDTVVMPGDLVVLDEVWRWWADGDKVTKPHMTFFRMHRHFLHPLTAVSCDVVLITQHIGDLARALKRVIEFTFVMTKLKITGSDERYRVDVYDRDNIRKKPLRELFRKYDPAVFVLYQSYSQGGGKSGKESVTDGRVNIFRGAMFTMVLPGVLLMFLGCVWWTWRYFHPSASASASASAPAAAPAVAAKAATVPAQAPPSVPSGPAVSDWRLVGWYISGPYHVALMEKAGAVRRVIAPPGFLYDRIGSSGRLDGLQVAGWTGTRQAGGMLGGVGK